MIAGEPTASRERAQGTERVIVTVGEERGKGKMSGAVVESTASEEATAEVGEERERVGEERERERAAQIRHLPPDLRHCVLQKPDLATNLLQHPHVRSMLVRVSLSRSPYGAASSDSCLESHICWKVENSNNLPRTPTHARLRPCINTPHPISSLLLLQPLVLIHSRTVNELICREVCSDWLEREEDSNEVVEQDLSSACRE